MGALVVEHSTEDQIASRAATEAVLGLLAKARPVNQEAVRVWLSVSLHENTEMIARAMHYASRVIDGPLPNGS